MTADQQRPVPRRGRLGASDGAGSDAGPGALGMTAADVEELGRELDQLRTRVLASLGEDDSRYIRRVIGVQRLLEVCGRATLFASALPPAWLAGTMMLATAKILENMEIGHNVLHGQWDWLGDPAIRSTTWESDSVSPADQWRRAHNYRHHTFTNVEGRDRDLGFGILRMTPAQRWRPIHVVQPLYNLGLAMTFEWGIAIFDLELDRFWSGDKSWRETRADLGATLRKVRRQVLKDYVLFPALAGPVFLPVLAANLTANLVRNLWAHTIIFCGHFPDGAATFTPEDLDGETRGQWYLRQLRGSANIEGSPLFHILSGNLSHQIEHHLFPDLPSNRYAQIAPQVRALCERFDILYTTGSLSHQTGEVWRRILRLSRPGPSRTPEPARPGQLVGSA
ncbi:acyl-CoA desaturase [Frankia sp. AgB1.8]|uniref:fatty acid desaturase family protein n=1 Tax=unclassified Frankia TaxID=2632575 RepID=UPI001EE4BE57